MRRALTSNYNRNVSMTCFDSTSWLRKPHCSESNPHQSRASIIHHYSVVRRMEPAQQNHFHIQGIRSWANIDLHHSTSFWLDGVFSHAMLWHKQRIKPFSGNCLRHSRNKIPIPVLLAVRLLFTHVWYSNEFTWKMNLQNLCARCVCSQQWM